MSAASCVPTQYVTVDEQLVSFRGRWPFNQYIKSRPGKYCIKIWASADANTNYIHNMQVYTGRKQGEPREQSESMRVVQDLVPPLFGIGRVVRTDFFTSFHLAQYLLAQNITLTGSLRKNKPDIRKIFMRGKGRKVFLSLFGFHSVLILTWFVPKKNSMVLVSSYYHDK
jgi:hypothetical protein